LGCHPAVIPQQGDIGRHAATFRQFYHTAQQPGRCGRPFYPRLIRFTRSQDNGSVGRFFIKG
jgi:hypothetical protein